MSLPWIRPLCRWYENKARGLPWRESRDPYRIWISEIMLQQTQVATVIPYYEKFLSAFPDVNALASAPIDRVLSLWAGLGYYSRARNLHRAAQTLRDRYRGDFPREREKVLEIPGIGPYTAGAILSIAFDLPVPLVDGNVERFLSRLYGIKQEIKSKEAQRQLWEIAGESVRQSVSPRVFNQALMEMGAIVCIKGKPRCEQCPVKSYCIAYAKDLTEKLPVRKERRKPVDLHWTAVIFERDGRLLLRQNGGSGWWQGLWDFPRLDGETEDAIRSRFAKSREIFRLPDRKHTVTHHKITLSPWVVRLGKKSKVEKLPKGEWFTNESLRELALSSPARKLATELDVLK